MARKDPHSYADLDQGRIRHVDLALEADFEAKSLKGTATLLLESSHAGRLDLDTRDLDILSVQSDRGDLDFEIGEPDPILGQRLSIIVPEDIGRITISYATSPEATALQWLEPVHTAGKEYPYLFSQCQPHHARSMIPLQDTPQVRFTYSARLEVPAGLSAVMSAAPGRKKEQGAKWEFYFEMPQPIPSYLVALAVGRIESQDLGPRTRVYAEPEVLPAAAYEFERVEDMVTAAEGIFGPYLWERFDFIVMPPAFPYGGMENPRLTFLTPTLLAGDRSLVNVLAHELAHSWTGNLVTNATMNDFWLNEGFTVWAERRILEKLEGPEYKALHAAIGFNGLKDDLKRFKGESDYTKLKTDLQGIDPDDVYSLVPYEKGFLFVTLLEQAAGRSRFDEFMKKYMNEFAFKSLETETFLEFAEKELPGVLEQVKAEEWIYGPGLPDNVPVFKSSRLDEIHGLVSEWPMGRRPGKEVAAKWSPEEWQLFLQGLSEQPLTKEDCRWLDQNFGLSHKGNAEIKFSWLRIAASCAYEPAFADIEEFLGNIGRMKYLKPLYSTLNANQETRDMARNMFERFKDRYHPIARAGLAKLLA